MKKLLSIVLISAMVLALVPSAFATTTETSTDNLVRAYNFDFGAAGYAGIDGQIGKTEIAHATLQQYGDTYTADGETSTRTGVAPTTWANTNTDPWVVDAQSYLGNLTLTTSASDNKQADALYFTTYQKRVYSNAANQEACLAIRLTIDKPGTYIPKLTYYGRTDLCMYDLFLVPISSSYLSSTYTPSLYIANANQQASSGKTLKATIGVFVSSSPANKKTYLGKIDMYEATNGIVSTELTGNNTTNAKSLNVIEVTAEDIQSTTEYLLFLRSNGVNEALTSTYGSNSTKAVYTNLFSFELYREKTTEEKAAEESFDASVDEDEIVTNSASVELLKYNGEKSKSIGSVEDVTYGKSVTIPAVDKTYTDEETGKTYNFLYWAKGLEEGVSKQILSTSYESFPYKPHAGVNYLIAVYEEADNAKEAFYNKNGQLLTDLGIKDNKLPALPAMAGRGDAIKWVQRGTDAEFDGGADVSNLEGDKVFMAKYNEPTEGNIAINGKKYFYGDTISCKDIVDSTENFSYFTRQIGNGEAEIISIDPDYSFSAYTDCEISAVCNGAVTLTTPRKIALSTFSVGENLTAVMAEFIGFEDAKEKGIMFGTQKIAMTTDKAQFTVTNDTEDDVVVTGYAIVGDDKYVDGEITVAGTTSAE